MEFRSLDSGTERMSRPSRKRHPSGDSKSRVIRWTNVLLPAPTLLGWRRSFPPDPELQLVRVQGSSGP